ncbi:MAG: amidohydrolase [Chloroflexi bacterium]|nr:amidohydrolase [Chloroflexota bacterium]
MIIDFHTHIVPPKMKDRRDELVHEDDCLGSLFSDPKANMATAEDLIESMDKDGIDISVVVNMGWSSFELCHQTNDYILESINKYPKRLIGFCTIHPEWKEAPGEIERCAKGGIRGIGELMPHLQNFDLGDKALMAPIVEVAQKNDMIIMTHSSEPVGHIYPGKGNVLPGMLYQFITNFPEACIVCAHWGGGLPFYALMSEVGEALKNVYFDTAASPFLYKYAIFQHVSEIAGADKILFGSDFPLITQKRIVKRLLEEISISQDNKDLILGNNAFELLGLS